MPRFAILGHPVAHSLSPKFYNAEFKKRGLKNYVYAFYDCPPEKLSEAMDKIRCGEYQGYSVTIPHKEAVMPYLNELSPIAKRVGAVNTIIRREDGTLFGDNTDYVGFREALLESNVKCQRSKVNCQWSIVPHALVLGTGGAAKAVIAVLLDQGWKVTVGTRGKKKEYKDPKDPKDSKDGKMQVTLKTYEELDPHDNYQLIVNTTPVGMSPDVDKSPLDDPRWFRSDRIYADVIYTPKMTKFLKLAKKAGAKIITGDRMFYFQAMAQVELFCRNPSTAK